MTGDIYLAYLSRHGDSRYPINVNLSPGLSYAISFLLLSVHSSCLCSFRRSVNKVIRTYHATTSYMHA